METYNNNITQYLLYLLNSSNNINNNKTLKTLKFAYYNKENYYYKILKST